MNNIKKLRIFLASSDELKEERDAIETIAHRKNPTLIDHDLFLEIVRWEELLNSFQGDDIQTDYFNEEVIKCDIVIVLFFSKVGKFTKQEFEIAYNNFKNGEKPKYIFVYFKDAYIKIDDIDETVLEIKKMKDRIKEYKQIYREYVSIEDLLGQITNQLNIIINYYLENFFEFTQEEIIEQTSIISIDQGVAFEKLDKEKVRELAREVGLLNDWVTNPQLKLKEGDISWFFERNYDRWDLEAQFRARLLVLQKAERVEKYISDPGKLSALAANPEGQIKRMWQIMKREKSDKK